MRTECLVFGNRCSGDSTISLKNYLEIHHPDYYVTTDLKSALCITAGYLEDKDSENLEDLKFIVNNLQLANVKASFEKGFFPGFRYYDKNK